MCARYAFFTGKITNDEAGIVPLPDIKPRWNIAPGQWAMVAAEQLGGRRMLPMRWGLIPCWADPLNAQPLVNARAETAKEKPSFQAAFRSRRCVIPADGYYEWRQEGRVNQPYFISRSNGGTLLMAGLYEEHEGLQTFAVLTCEAGGGVEDIHPRMPVILEGMHARRWLSTDWHGGDRVPLGSPEEGALHWWPVGREVGKVEVEGASLARPMPKAQGSLFPDFE